MPAGTEADPLFEIVDIRPALEIFAFEAGQIDQHLLGRGFAGQRRNGHAPILFTGHGFARQISAAYWAIVWSLENLPLPATLRMALRAQASLSAYNAVSLWSASRYDLRSTRCM